jgi:Sap, sulfolipid-1-addressing protein
VIQGAAYIVFYGIIAAVSPLVLSATFIVIRSKRKRTNSIAYLTGFVLGTTIACILGLLLGQAATDNLDSRETIDGLFALLIGVVLVVVALSGRRGPMRPETETGRAAAILAGLEHVGPGAAFWMAGLLGFGGPKRLLVTFLAMAAVSADAVGPGGDLVLVVLYIVTATAFVSVPVVIIVATGDRGVGMVERAESWFLRHSPALRLWVGLVIGTLLIIDGVLRLTR